MKNEIRIFFTALMFYTRIPCPGWVGHHPEFINKSTRYFPLIGWIVGSIAALTLIGSLSVFSEPSAVTMSIGISILLTGAFHEDEFADVCDGFGAGRTSEKILEIMKDSRLGTFGVAGLLLVLLLKLFFTLEVLRVFSFDWLIFALLIISSHSLSRFLASTLMVILCYVGDTDGIKPKPSARSFEWKIMLPGGFFGVAPFLFFVYLLNQWMLLFAVIPLIVMNTLLSRYYYKRIGGYTGDCLGAVQQVTEVLFLATMVAIWKFI